MNVEWTKLDLQEEEIFAELMHFLLRKNHRYLSGEEIVKKTGVSADLIYKWVKAGKFKRTLFPNIGAPCERCGEITQSRICLSCSTSMLNTLEKEERDRLWFQQIHSQPKQFSTYHYSKM